MGGDGRAARRVGRADRRLVRRRGGAGGAGRVGGDRAGGRRVHRARRRRGDGGAAADGRRRADAARPRVQVRALRDARGRAGGVGRRHRRRAGRRARPRSCIRRTSTAPALPLDELAPLARAAGVPVVVDAAYQCFPLSELERWSTAGDVACFSAKYFWGPNAGGFVAGRAGARRPTSRRSTSPATSPGRGGRSGGRSSSIARRSPRPWRRWRSGGGRPRRAAGAATRRWPRSSRSAVSALPGARIELKQFTLDERLRRRAGQRGRACAGAGDRWSRRWPPGDPSVRAIVAGDALVFCTEALTGGEVAEIGAADVRGFGQTERRLGVCRYGPFGRWSVDTVLLDSSARSSEHRAYVGNRRP